MRPDPGDELARVREALSQARAQLALEQSAREAAERMNAQKDQFVGLVVHELRSPLGAILGWAHMLRRRGGQEEFDKGLAVIEQSVHQQARLIDSLSDLTRLVSGQVHLDLQPVQARSIIDAAVDAAAAVAQVREVGIRQVLDLTTGMVLADAGRLHQVVSILLTNALQHAPAGGSVDVVLRRAGAEAEISIADAGGGIPPALLPHVFDVLPPGQPRFGDLGLALPIARQVVELHGGRIRADSPGEGRGATFTVRLPLASGAREPS